MWPLSSSVSFQSMMADILERFLQGVAAAAHLFNRAVENKSALECIVLQASLLDATLRVGLILKKQLDSKSSVIDEEILSQGLTDSRISEREIYKRCRDTVSYTHLTLPTKRIV